MCSIEAHDIENPTANDDASVGGGRPLKKDSQRTKLVSLGITLNSISI